MLNRLLGEVGHLWGELTSGEHRLAWWLLLAAAVADGALLAHVLQSLLVTYSEVLDGGALTRPVTHVYILWVIYIFLFC